MASGRMESERRKEGWSNLGTEWFCISRSDQDKFNTSTATLSNSHVL